MLLRPTIILRITAVLAILYTLHITRGTYRFQRYLATRHIRANDFPDKYMNVLNSSVAAHEQPPLDFDYASTFPDTKMPKIIHFIWFQNLYDSENRASQIPKSGSHAPELCRKFNPSYEIRMWNASSARTFMAEHYEWFLNTYDNYRYPIQRIDALKYFILWHYGGVYMDLDIACRRPLDPLLAFPAWFPEASPLGVNNDLMAARRGHPILERMTRRLEAKNRNWIFPYLTIFWSTGPSFGSDILREWVEGGYEEVSQRKGTTESDAFFVLPQIYYSETHTFFGHSPGGTWHGGDVAFILWFVDHPWIFLIFAGVVALVFVRWLQRRRRRLLNQKDEDERKEGTLA